MISDFAKALAGRLDFDPALSRRVQREVEDHLWEAVAAEPWSAPAEAERRAIARFGDPQAIAAQFAVVALAKQARRVGVAVVLVIAAAFIAMQARLAWYAVMQWAASGNPALSAVVATIDRYAFWLSIVLALAAAVYIAGRAVPLAFSTAYRRRLRRFSLLCAAAAGALVVSVACDGVLTSLRLAASGWSAACLVPLLSMAIEIAAAGLLISYVHGMARRTAATTKAGWL
jgi:hypothetical protein